MKRLFLLLGIILAALFPLACQKTYSLGPLPVPTAPTSTPLPTLAPTLTFTSTASPSPTCGLTVSILAGSAGVAGAANGTGTAATFQYPFGIAVDGPGNLYVADGWNNLIRKISSGAVVTTLAGSGAAGNTDAVGTAASFDSPEGVAVDASGNVYVADFYNDSIRKITPGGAVTTWAGYIGGGFVNGTGTLAGFWGPTGVAVDTAGNVYVADMLNNMIRKITPGAVVSTLAGQLTAGAVNATGTAASFNQPESVAVDSVGNVYVSDRGNFLIRKITPGGVVTTLAGSGTQAYVDGIGTAASFNSPEGIAVDGTGKVYVADVGDDVIRKITPGGVVTTMAGKGYCYTFSIPWGIAIDSSGKFYVTDYSNQLILTIQ